ncbi:MAG: endonuclease/exonuclease/phosphatase family protein [Paracoccaceae bacterium]|nr:MAG: endonuclease/exonuclease/phosphatase family protein [Paracoccaceae bacterium]
MRRVTILLVCLGALSALAACAIANRFNTPPALQTADIQGIDRATRGMPDRLTVTTWNIGYAGMGAESDFVLDLGEQRRPLSGALVDRNLAEITRFLRDLDSDIVLLQEVARPSWVTWGRDVLAGVVSALPGHAHFFWPDIQTLGIPRPFRVEVGNAVFSRIRPTAAEWRGLPLEPTFQLGVFRKGYRMHILRIDESRSWVIINIHLSTFDSVEDDVRAKQVTALMAFAEQEYRKGNHVVIGGDWNLRLVATRFPDTTEERFKFWIRDLPRQLIPEGWTIAADPSVPSVRTAHKPYVAGENHVLVIDGFIASPNVAVRGVAGTDLGFRHSDHQPVTAVFEARR